MHARIPIDDREVGIDLSRPLDLALELDFSAAQPRHFGAPRASARAFETAGFTGSVARGSSCNCDVISLIPHCNGTHTECAGHLTRERLDAWRVAPRGFVPALLLSVVPEAPAGEDSEPLPLAGDQLITQRALERAWPARVPFVPRALIIRTLPNSEAKRVCDYTALIPPYLSQQAAARLVSRGILHLVVDVPSIDRTHDEGRLTAHRIFFGLPRAATGLALATRATATITELAFVPDEVADGPYLLELQVPALAGDAVPSRPILYPLTERGR